MTLQSEHVRADHHTAYSATGRWAHLLSAIDPTVEAVSAVVRNVIVHYREEQTALPEHTRGDIHDRWVARTLERDQDRHGAPLTAPREIAERVQGCCRDHTLLACAVLREHGIPARGRVGFARYLRPDFNHDHVVVEAQLEEGSDRWVRFDPELTGPLGSLTTPTDMPVGAQSPFPTAAEVWRSWRGGDINAQDYGVAPGHPACGPWLIQNYVLRDLAHRCGDELLLWDVWGAMAHPGPVDADLVDLTDRVAGLIVAADAGDRSAAADLRCWYRSDPRLHPGPTVLRHDPFRPGAAPVEEELPQRR